MDRKAPKKSAKVAKKAVVVSVRDSGIGMPAAILPHIFEMFSQAAPVLQRSHGGLGIGLALVRGLVELHGGRVEAHSAGPGKGSEFIVRLPAAEGLGKAAAASTGASQPACRGPKGRILVV